MIAIDPGPNESAVVWLRDNRVKVVQHYDNWSLRDDMRQSNSMFHCDSVAIEWVECFGMAVGKEVFETVLWIGRFMEVLPTKRLIPRRDIKMHLCQSMRAKDTNIRQALIDKLGPVGTKKNPGPCFGVSNHLWSALAVAVVASECPETPNEFKP